MQAVRNQMTEFEKLIPREDEKDSRGHYYWSYFTENRGAPMRQKFERAAQAVLSLSDDDLAVTAAAPYMPEWAGRSAFGIPLNAYGALNSVGDLDKTKAEDRDAFMLLAKRWHRVKQEERAAALRDPERYEMREVNVSPNLPPVGMGLAAKDVPPPESTATVRQIVDKVDGTVYTPGPDGLLLVHRTSPVERLETIGMGDDGNLVSVPGAWMKREDFLSEVADAKWREVDDRHYRARRVTKLAETIEANRHNPDYDPSLRYVDGDAYWTSRSRYGGDEKAQQLERAYRAEQARLAKAPFARPITREETWAREQEDAEAELRRIVEAQDRQFYREHPWLAAMRATAERIENAPGGNIVAKATKDMTAAVPAVLSVGLRSVQNTANQIAGFIKAGGETGNIDKAIAEFWDPRYGETGPLTEPADWLESAASALTRKNKPETFWGTVSDPSELVGRAAGAIPYLVGIAAVTAKNPKTGAVMMTMMAKENIRQQALAAGASPRQANMAGYVGGAIEAAIEFAQVSGYLRLVNKNARRELSRNVARVGLRSALAPGAMAESRLSTIINEGLEEALQGLNQDWWVAKAANQPVHFQINNALLDALTASLTAAAAAGAGGATLSDAERFGARQTAMNMLQRPYGFVRDAVSRLWRDEEGELRLPTHLEEAMNGNQPLSRGDVKPMSPEQLADPDRPIWTEAAPGKGQAAMRVDPQVLMEGLERQAALGDESAKRLLDDIDDRVAGVEKKYQSGTLAPVTLELDEGELRDTGSWARIAWAARQGLNDIPAFVRSGQRTAFAEYIPGGIPKSGRRESKLNPETPEQKAERQNLSAALRTLQRNAPIIYRQAGLDRVGAVKPLVDEAMTLPPAERGKLIKQMSEARTEGEINAAGERIKAMQERVYQKERRNASLAAHSAIVSEARQKLSTMPEPYRSNVQRLLDSYAISAVDDARLANAESFVANYESLPDSALTPSLLAQYKKSQQIIDQASKTPLSKMSPEAIDQITSELAQQTMVATLDVNLRRSVRKEELDAVIGEIVKGIEGEVAEPATMAKAHALRAIVSERPVTAESLVEKFGLTPEQAQQAVTAAAEDVALGKLPEPEGDVSLPPGPVRQALSGMAWWQVRPQARAAAKFNEVYPDPGQRGQGVSEVVVHRSLDADRFEKKLTVEGHDAETRIYAEQGIDKHSPEAIRWLRDTVDVALPSRPDKPLRITRGDLATLYAKFRNASTVKLLADVGFVERGNEIVVLPKGEQAAMAGQKSQINAIKLTDEDMRAIRNATEPNLRRITDALLEESERIFAKVQAAAIAAEKQPPVRSEDWDFSRTREAFYSMADPVDENFYANWSAYSLENLGLDPTKAGWTKTRTGGGAGPIIIEPIDVVWDRYVRNTSSYISRVGTMHDAAQVLADKGVRTAIAGKYGDRELSYWDSYLQGVMTVGPRPEGGFMPWLTRNWAASKLGFKYLTVIPRQYGSNPIAAHLIDPARGRGFRAFAQNIGAIADPEVRERMFRYSPETATRAQHSPVEYYNPGGQSAAGRRQVKTDVGPKRRRFADVVTQGIRNADVRALTHQWAAIESLVDEDNPGLRESDPDAFYRKVNDIHVETMVRTAPVGMSAVDTAAGIAARRNIMVQWTATMFKSFFQQSHSLLVDETVRFSRSQKTPQDYGRVARAYGGVGASILYSLAVNAAGRFGVGYLLAKAFGSREKRDLKKETVIDAIQTSLGYAHPMASIALDTFDAFTHLMSGRTREFSVPLTDVMNESRQFADMIGRLLRDGADEKEVIAAGRMLNGLAGILTGFPEAPGKYALDIAESSIKTPAARKLSTLESKLRSALYEGQEQGEVDPKVRQTRELIGNLKKDRHPDPATTIPGINSLRSRAGKLRAALREAKGAKDEARVKRIEADIERIEKMIEDKAKDILDELEKRGLSTDL